jgi:hypothetical protein
MVFPVISSHSYLHVPIDVNIQTRAICWCPIVGITSLLDLWAAPSAIFSRLFPLTTHTVLVCMVLPFSLAQERKVT